MERVSGFAKIIRGIARGVNIAHFARKCVHPGALYGKMKTDMDASREGGFFGYDRNADQSADEGIRRQRGAQGRDADDTGPPSRGSGGLQRVGKIHAAQDFGGTGSLRRGHAVRDARAAHRLPHAAGRPDLAADGVAGDGDLL